jgi:hypothetical protein
MQTERNNGGRFRSLVDLTWADGWLADAGMSRDNVPAEHADEVARIDEAERVYWSCEPMAREVAERDHPICGDWEDLPSWYEEHATIAEREDAALRDDVVLEVRSDGIAMNVTLADFANSNSDAPDVVAEARTLPVGNSITVGGGAAPVFIVTRVK